MLIALTSLWKFPQYESTQTHISSLVSSFPPLSSDFPLILIISIHPLARCPFWFLFPWFLVFCLLLRILQSYLPKRFRASCPVPGARLWPCLPSTFCMHPECTNTRKSGMVVNWLICQPPSTGMQRTQQRVVHVCFYSEPRYHNDKQCICLLNSMGQYAEEMHLGMRDTPQIWEKWAGQGVYQLWMDSGSHRTNWMYVLNISAEWEALKTAKGRWRMVVSIFNCSASSVYWI